MHLSFVKYQGTGNDFILIDNRLNQYALSCEQVSFLCNRHLGIGADGLMLLESAAGMDFKMVYYNADGNQSTMCGNGGRCITAFAKQLNIIQNKAHFLAVDGLHESVIDNDNFVALKMKDVKSIEHNQDHFFLDTGSPHYVELVAHLAELDVHKKGSDIRYNERFKENGTNVNFIEKQDNAIFVRTYERGVEAETLSCGTGVTAAALVAATLGISTHKNKCLIQTKGGSLEVHFEKVLENTFYNIWLKGPATKVFEGSIELID